MMRKILALTVVLSALGGGAYAQSTAQPVITGYLSNSGCPSPALTPCFVQFGSGGGSGGGAVTIADGADVAQGTTTDPAWSSGAGTIVGILKNLAASLTTLAGSVTSSVFQNNIAKWGGTATSLGQKTMSASVPVAIASDQSAIPVAPSPAAQSAGGLSIKRLQVANNTTSVAIDASAGNLFGIEAFNNSGTIAYVKLYNAAQGSTTCGSGTPIYSGMIPGNASGGSGYIMMQTFGLPFSTAITACVTTGYADSDTTAPAATTYTINFWYK